MVRAPTRTTSVNLFGLSGFMWLNGFVRLSGFVWLSGFMVVCGLCG